MKKKIMLLLIVTLLISQISIVMATDSEELFETLVLYHPDYNINTVQDGDVTAEGNIHYFNDPILRDNHVYFHSPRGRLNQSSEIYFRSFNLDTNRVETMGVPEIGTHTVGHTDEVSKEHRFVAFDYDQDSDSLIYLIRNASSPYRYLSGKLYQIPTNISDKGNRIFQDSGKSTIEIGSTEATASQMYGTKYSSMLITEKSIYFNTNDPSNASIFQFNKKDGTNNIAQSFSPHDNSYHRNPGELMRDFPFYIDETERVRYKIIEETRVVPTPFARTFRSHFNGQHSIGGGASYIEFGAPPEKSRFTQLIAYSHDTGDRWLVKELDDHYIPVTVQDGQFYCTGPSQYEISRIDPITQDIEILYDMRKDNNAYPDIAWEGALPHPQPLGEYDGDLIFILPRSVVTPPRLMRAPIN